MATEYREVLLSLLYSGEQTSLASLQPVVRALQDLLRLNWQQRQRTLVRIDGGFGDDTNLNWLLRQGYQVLAKGYSGKRAKAFARRVASNDWLTILPDKCPGQTLAGLVADPTPIISSDTHSRRALVNCSAAGETCALSYFAHPFGTGSHRQSL